MAEPSDTRLRYQSADLAQSLSAAGEAGQPRQDTILRRYRVMGSCGTGGFGTVLACWDTRLQRRVAVKRMPLVPAALAESPDATKMRDSSTIGEALGEARTASRLEHPGIVAVHDFAVEGGIAYLVMEYVDGITLQDLLQRVEGGTLTPDEAAYLVQELGHALAFAHEHGVLHLDIKPSNIMITREGGVKLCDFGMATLASATGYGDARGGTVGYMPPEQITDGLVDERSDVFALAVVLYQALVGANPFAAPTAEKSLALIERGPKVRPSKLLPGMAGIAEQTLLACLSPDPGDRPADAATVSSDLAFGLGDPDAGEDSIKLLMAQTEGGEDEEEDVWEGERLPVSYRYPWLGTAILRVTSALTVGAVVFGLAPYLPGASGMPPLALAAATAAISGLWPPAGTLVGILSLDLALVVGIAAHGAASLAGVAVALLSVVLTAGLVAWWVFTREDPGASAALLLAPALAEPAAASAIAALELEPVPAGVAAGVSWLLAWLVPAAVAGGFGPQAVADALVGGIGIPSLIALFGAVLGAGAGSVVTRSGDSVARSVTGQLVCAGCVVFFQLLAQRMKNGGIWGAPGWSTAGVAVLLCVFVCLSAVLRGPREETGEDED